MAALQASIVRPQAGNHAFIAEIVPAGDLLYLVGGTHHEPTLLASSDAVHFYKQKTPNKPGLRSFLVLGTKMYVCGEYGGLFESDDGGKSWDALPTNTNGCLFALATDGEAIWTCGDDGYVARSADDDWEQVDIDTKARVQNVYGHAGYMYFACFNGELVRRKESEDTVHLDVLLTGPAPITDMQSTPFGFFVVGDQGQLWRSTDGETFLQLPVVGADIDLEAITYSEAGIFVVGSKGTILHSTDGAKFAFLDADTRAHLFCVTATGRGAFIGGEGGLLVHAKPDDDTTWAGKADTLLEVAGELDAFFCEAAPETFVLDALPKLMNVPAPDLKPNADFEAIWGTKLPDEINAFLQLIDQGVDKVLYEWRPENGLVENPPAEENLFEWFVMRDQGAYLGTGLPELFCGLVCLGSYGNGDTHHASIYGAEDFEDRASTPAGARTMLIFDHEEHHFAFETATSVSRMAYFSALYKAWASDKVSENAARECFDRVRGQIHPSWHFTSGIEEAGFEKFAEYEDPKPYARVWYARGVWLTYLLRADGVVDVEDVRRMFYANQNPILDGEVHARWTKSAQRFVPTALYCLLRGFYFDDPKLGEYLEIARNHGARIVRDAARLVDDTLAGKRKALGKIPDWLAQRARFQKLDLDPAREAARQAEAAERAAAAERARGEMRERVEAAIAKGEEPAAFAWDALEDVNVHEVVEAALRDMPALAATFRSVDFVLNAGFHRENLILSHEKDEEIEWLAIHGDARIVPLLLGTLMRPQAEAKGTIWTAHPNHAGELLEAFAERGRVDARAAAPLRKLLAVEEKYEFRRARAIDLLGHLRDRDALPALLELAKTLPTDDMIAGMKKKDLGQAIARSLGRLGDASAIPTLTTMLTATDRTAKDYRSWTALALAELGATSTWKDALEAAAAVDRKPTCWLIWAVGMLGANADPATKKEITTALAAFEPKWGATAIDLTVAGVMARLGAAPEDFATKLDEAFTKPGYDEKTTEANQEWAMRVIGVTDASTTPLKASLLRDKQALRHAARTALEQRGQAVPPVKMLARAEVAQIEAEGVTALIAALEDETAIFRHVVAGRLGELGAQAARPALIRYVRALLATTTAAVGYKMSNDVSYSLRWTLKALNQLGSTPELTALLAEILVHPSRDVKDPVLRYAKDLSDPGLIEAMIRVADERYGWQESTANEWLERAKTQHPAAYEAAIAKLRLATS